MVELNTEELLVIVELVTLEPETLELLSTTESRSTVKVKLAAPNLTLLEVSFASQFQMYVPPSMLLMVYEDELLVPLTVVVWFDSQVPLRLWNKVIDFNRVSSVALQVKVIFPVVLQ